MSENEQPQLGVHRIVMPCARCHGAGWCWCDELDNRAGHDPHALVVDDTRYSCPDCGGTGNVVDDECTCPTLDGVQVTGSSCPIHGFPTCEI